MTTFAVTDPTQTLSAINYLLSNLDVTGGSGNVTIPANVIVANTTTGIINTYGNTSGGNVAPFWFLYPWINLRYGNSSTGSGFSTVPTNSNWFGVYNSQSSAASVNPADYTWTEIAGGFGVTKDIYYAAYGGRQVSFIAAASPPSSSYILSVANTAIDLDTVTTAAGSAGQRGAIAMAYVVTTADPNGASQATLTGWFGASRSNTVPPIGTGLTPPVPGDTAQFTYAAGVGRPTATYTFNGSIWIPAIAQVIDGNVIITGSIAGNAIIANTITSLQIATDTITANNIAGNTITGDKIAGNTIQGNSLIIGTVTATQIANGTITTNQIAANTITANNIAGNTITGNKLVIGTVTSTQIANGTITTNNIAANTITGNNIAGNTIQGNNLIIGTITSTQIANGTITTNNIAANTITSNNIAANSIVGSDIQGNTISGNNLVIGTITSTQIANGTITTNNIAANTITSNNIAANSIVGSDIQGNTITGDKIVTNTITANNIAAATITGTQIAANTITSTNLAAGTIIVANSIQSNNATFGSNSSDGYWLDSATGNARFGGNISIGNSLVIGANCVVGNNLAVAGLITLGNLNSNTVVTSTIYAGAVSGGIGNIGAVGGTLGSPIPGQVYVTPTKVTLATSETNQALYISATQGWQFQMTAGIGSGTLVVSAELLKTSPGGGTTASYRQTQYLAFTTATTTLLPTFNWSGILDQPATIGSYSYQTEMFYNITGSGAVTQITYGAGSMLIQTLKR